MPLKFNPFSGNFDFTGSGGGGGSSYIDGEVQNFSALPETLGTPPEDSAYLVREAEGSWLLGRKPAGIYIRSANTGVRADDWTHASAFPDVFNDANLVVYSDADSTKNVKFSASGITTGTTRTLTAPDASGEISLTSHTHELADLDSSGIAAGKFLQADGNDGAQWDDVTDADVPISAATASGFPDGNGIYYPISVTLNSRRVFKLNKTYGMFFEASKWHIFENVPITANILYSSNTTTSNDPWGNTWADGDVDQTVLADSVAAFADQFGFVGDDIPSTSVTGLGTAAASDTGDFAAASHTHTAADVDSGASAEGTFLQSNGSGGAGWNNVSYVDLEDVPINFTPSTHASSHATGGSDAIAPSDIGAQYAFVTSSANLTADTTLSSGRTRKIFLNNYSSPAATITVTLPTTGNESGDILVLEGSTLVDDIDIKNNPTGSVIATISASGQTFRFIYVGSWEIDRVYNHASQHASGGIDELALAASQITSGTLAHERGGLEADVSAYNGLLKIASGSTSAVTVTAAGEALLDDADAAAQRTTLGLGNSATLDTGTTAGTVAEGDHTHELNALDATGATDGHVLTADGAGGAAFEALPASGIAETLLDAKGDLIVASAADTAARLAVGSNGTMLVADSGETTGVKWAAQPVEYVVACSDETSDLTTGTAKVTFRAPVAFLLTGVAASVNTAPTGSTLIVDINNGANSALSTKLSIDASEKTSATAATAAVIDTTYDDFAADAEITIDIDQIGSTIAGKGLKVILKGTRA